MSGSQPSHESKVGFAEFRGAEPSLKGQGDGDPGKGLALLGGGFKYFVFSPLFGEMIHFDQYVWNGLKPPTSLA